MPNLTEGDYVRVADRDAVAADTKSQLFFPHYRGLGGTVSKIYADRTAAVDIAADSLPVEIRKRHDDGSEAQRRKWLDGLSDEARNRLSAAEKRFRLRYTILVSLDDLHAETAPEGGETPVRRTSSDLDDAETRHLDEVARRKNA